MGTSQNLVLENLCAIKPDIGRMDAKLVEVNSRLLSEGYDHPTTSGPWGLSAAHLAKARRRIELRTQVDFEKKLYSKFCHNEFDTPLSFSTKFLWLIFNAPRWKYHQA
ncbi:MAG: hypothetical protein DM484_04310 [Candidatus Methylumidiphilus alinenensis]|uniref:Uncharacterized protein n=1 Tax=Candidatus Methylumidiphilus alinenensis TaxID=2202197 RepID=A0A2W4TM12_9GAMM|nr:MAG: hypothetical protein DM484_04310 [Candidatus Methylumidiphilus alinenensis]